MQGTDGPHKPERRRGRRRRSDRIRFKDVVYFTGILLIAAGTWQAFQSNSNASNSNRLAAQADRHATEAITRQQQGRAVAITITCAVLSSISETGKAVIAGSPKPPPKAEERALEAIGFPPFSVRHAKQASEGDAYVGAISKRVNRELAQLGKRPIKGLIRSDGTIDCKVLQKVGGVPAAR